MNVRASGNGAAVRAAVALLLAFFVLRPGGWRHAPPAVLLVVHPEPDGALPAGLWPLCHGVRVVQQHVFVAKDLLAEFGVVVVPG